MKWKGLAISSGTFVVSEPTNFNHMLANTGTKKKFLGNSGSCGSSYRVTLSLTGLTHKRIACADRDGAIVQYPQRMGKMQG